MSWLRHVPFEPLELLERLAVITPRPRVNLIRYHGVLGPHAAWRTDVVRRTGAAAATEERCDADPGGAGHAREPTRPDTRSPSWAELMRRGFGFDVLVCPRCGQRMRLIALIDQAAVVERLLHHLDLPTEVPEPAPARAPPCLPPLLDAYDQTGEPAVDSSC